MFTTYVREEDSWKEEEKTIWEWNEEDNKKYHYVAFAIPGLTYAASYFAGKRGLHYKELFYAVNSANEAGTLFPLCKATFLPVRRANYYMETIVHREKGPTEEEYRNYFRDVSKANLAMRTDTIVFDLRDFELRTFRTHRCVSRSS